MWTIKESKFYRFFAPVVPKKLRPFFLKHQRMLSYLFFGAATTLVNFLVYLPLNRVVHYAAANVIAWVAAVLFAFFVNKGFVFEDDRWDRNALLRQLLSFGAARLLSLGMEEAILLIFVELLRCNSNVTKIFAQILVVIFNYFASRLLFAEKPDSAADPSASTKEESHDTEI